MDAEVIVVGAGPAGSATAWGLARNGVDVLLLDRAHFPRDKACAEYLSPQASRILDEMGVLSEVESAGAAQLSGMTVRAPNGAEIRGAFAAAHGYHGFRDRGLALRRSVLDAMLLERARAAGARVQEGVTVTDIVQIQGRASGVRLGLTAPALTASLVIGADGLRSVVARRLRLVRHARWPHRLAFVTHYHGVADVGPSGEMHVEPNGYIGLADVGHGETNVALVMPSDRVRALPPQARATLIDDWIATHPYLSHRFRHARRSSEIHATGPFAHTVRRAWAPGAALVGDAADFFDPFTGEGIYTALRGAELLTPYVYDAVRTRKPGAAHQSDIALAAYDRCRRFEFRHKQQVEKLIALAVAFPPLINHFARTLARRREMADMLVGVAGDFVPAQRVLRPSYLWRLLVG